MIIYGKTSVAGFARQNTALWPLQALLFFQVRNTSGAPPIVDTGAGEGRWKKRRYILPDGKVYIDPNEAYQALEIWTRARLAEPELLKPKRKGSKRKSVSIKPKITPLMADVPLPQLVTRLPAKERARIDQELIVLADTLAQERADEEAILVLLLTT